MHYFGLFAFYALVWSMVSLGVVIVFAARREPVLWLAVPAVLLACCMLASGVHSLAVTLQ
jgi:hypothetical protein